MSTKAKAYISKEYQLDDIKDVMESYLDIKEQKTRKKNLLKKYVTIKKKVEVIPTSQLGMTEFVFIYNDKKRWMTVFDNTDLSIKGLYELHIGCDEDGVHILETIVKVLGGLLERDDGVGNIEDFHGMLSPTNGLPYFIRYAIIHNKIESEDDLVGLNEVIHEWYEKVDYKVQMKLFPRQKK